MNERSQSLGGTLPERPVIDIDLFLFVGCISCISLGEFLLEVGLRAFLENFCSTPTLGEKRAGDLHTLQPTHRLLPLCRSPVMMDPRHFYHAPFVPEKRFRIPIYNF